MKTTGIIMSGDHPKLILEGIKTQTRRVIKPQFNVLLDQYSDGSILTNLLLADNKGFKEDQFIHCPYGGVGDKLWVRETWRASQFFDDFKPSEIWINEAIQFKDGFICIPKLDAQDFISGKWRPSLFMPRWASRILLEITEIRAERLQEISYEDAQAEGIGGAFIEGRARFAGLWDSRNAKRGYGWDKNPWVWVISFKVVKMIDTAKPTRVYRSGETRTLYPCSGCRENLVTKQNGLCRVCAAKKRERRLKIEGTNRRALTLTHRARKNPKSDHDCVPHWMIITDEANGHDIGYCDKGDRCDTKTRALLCRDTGLPCPHKGVRDFTVLQDRNARRWRALESNRKGGARFKERAKTGTVPEI
jgi:hypothetical protein